MENKRTNCPNCGAPIKHYYNYNCEYCGTFLHNTDEEVKRIKNANIVITDVDIDRSPIRNAILITLRGETHPKWQYLEEGVSEIVLSGDTIVKPVAYRVVIPMHEFIESRAAGSMEFLWKYIINKLSPTLEAQEQNIITMLLDKVNSFWRNR